jgi:hypothetical protein
LYHAAAGEIHPRRDAAVLRSTREADAIPDTGTPKTKHVITNPWLEIDDAGGRARSIAHYTVLQRRETLPLQPIIAGHYEHRYERRPEGWRKRRAPLLRRPRGRREPA